MLKSPWSSFAVVLVEKRQYPQGSGSILIAYITTYFRIVLFHVQNALVIVSGCSWNVSNCFRYNVNFTLRGRDRFLFIEYFYSRSRSISSPCIPFTFNTNIQSKFEALILFRVNMIKLAGHALHLLSSENLCELVYTHISNQESYFLLVK